MPRKSEFLAQAPARPVGENDFAIVSFQYSAAVSPSIRPIFFLYDTKTGKYQLVDLSALPGDAIVDTNNHIIIFRFARSSGLETPAMSLNNS